MKTAKAPAPSAEDRALKKAQVTRMEELRVEGARETSKTLRDQMAFRRKLRGMFSLLSNDFKGFSA